MQITDIQQLVALLDRHSKVYTIRFNGNLRQYITISVDERTIDFYLGGKLIAIN